MRHILFAKQRDAQRWASNRNQSYRLADNLNAKTMAVVVTHPDGWVVMLAADALELEMPFSWS